MAQHLIMTHPPAQARSRFQLDAIAAWEGRNGHRAPDTYHDLPLFLGQPEGATP